MDLNHENDGFWVPCTFFLKKGRCPKSGPSDRTSDTPYILRYKLEFWTNEPDFGHFGGFKKEMVEKLMFLIQKFVKIM